MGQKKSRKPCFLTNFKLFPQLFASRSPQLWAKFVVLLHPSISFGVKLKLPKFCFYSLSQSKVIKELPLGGRPGPFPPRPPRPPRPPYSKGLCQISHEKLCSCSMRNIMIRYILKEFQLPIKPDEFSSNVK